jgi:hypothetical protein
MNNISFISPLAVMTSMLLDNKKILNFLEVRLSEYALSIALDTATFCNLSMITEM